MEQEGEKCKWSPNEWAFGGSGFYHHRHNKYKQTACSNGNHYFKSPPAITELKTIGKFYKNTENCEIIMNQ